MENPQSYGAAQLKGRNGERLKAREKMGTLSGRFASFFGVRCSRKTLALVQQFIVGSSSFFAKTNFLFKFITGKRR